MTPFGTSIAWELRGALVPVETVTIANFDHLVPSCRALVNNALFYVASTPAIEAARAAALEHAEILASTIRKVGIHPQGISLPVDLARADALVAFQSLIDAVGDAEPTPTGRCLGLG